MSAETLAAETLAAGTLAAGTLAAGTLAAGTVAVETVAAETVAAGTLAAGTVAAGTVAAATLAAPAEPASWDLVRRTQQGDAEAFGLLYDRYVETVYRFVYYRLGDRTQAEDLTSETFLRALRRISTVHEHGRDIGAWLVTIARNLMLDHVKSAQYRLCVSTEDIIDAHVEPAGDVTVATALHRLEQRALLEAVRQLSPQQQESIVLRFFHGLSLAETAAVMGRNAGAVKALQHRAMRRLQDLLSSPVPPPSRGTKDDHPAEDARSSRFERGPPAVDDVTAAALPGPLPT